MYFSSKQTICSVWISDKQPSFSLPICTEGLNNKEARDISHKRNFINSIDGYEQSDVSPMSYNETTKVVGNILQKYDKCSDTIKMYASTILVELSTVLEYNGIKDSVLSDENGFNNDSMSTIIRCFRNSFKPRGNQFLRRTNATGLLSKSPELIRKESRKRLVSIRESNSLTNQIRQGKKPCIRCSFCKHVGHKVNKCTRRSELRNIGHEYELCDKNMKEFENLVMALENKSHVHLMDPNMNPLEMLDMKGSNPHLVIRKAIGHYERNYDERIQLEHLYFLVSFIGSHGEISDRMDLITGNGLKLYLSSLMRFSKARYVYNSTHQSQDASLMVGTQTDYSTNVLNDVARYITPNRMPGRHSFSRNRDDLFEEHDNESKQIRDCSPCRSRYRIAEMSLERIRYDEYLATLDPNENLDIPNTRWDNFDPDLLPQDNLMGNQVVRYRWSMGENPMISDEINAEYKAENVSDNLNI